ncbi:MAG: trigger factor [Eubacterium sp.]|nr:trigger factor [Eubacterium sp.]
MSVTVEKLEKSMAKLTVEVLPEEFEKAVQQAYLKQKGKLSIPGFRKGKAPRAMIEKMYGAGIFYEDAANAILPEAYANAAKESELDITSTPDIEVTQIEKGKPFIFTATVALKPDVTLGIYKGVEVPRTDVTVTDEDVEAALKKEQDKNSRLVTLDDEAAADGDTVNLDYAGTIDGVAFEGGTAEGYDLTLGSGSFIPGFEEQLVGLKAGESKDVHVTFPEDYHAEELAGKEAVFACKINKISRKELPELDDEFAQEVSEFDTLEEYKADLKQKLTAQKEEEAKQSRRDNAVSRAAQAAEIEIPEPMLLTRCRDAVDNFAQRLAAQGLSMDQYMKFTGANMDMMMAQMRPQTEIQIRNELVLEAVAKAENLDASDEDVEKEFEEMAKNYNMEIDKVKELFPEDQRDMLKQDIAVRKAIDFLADNAVEVDEPEVKPEVDVTEVKADEEE